MQQLYFKSDAELFSYLSVWKLLPPSPKFTRGYQFIVEIISGFHQKQVLELQLASSSFDKDFFLSVSWRFLVRGVAIGMVHPSPQYLAFRHICRISILPVNVVFFTKVRKSPICRQLGLERSMVIGKN